MMFICVFIRIKKSMVIVIALNVIHQSKEDCVDDVRKPTYVHDTKIYYFQSSLTFSVWYDLSYILSEKDKTVVRITIWSVDSVKVENV